MLLALWQAFLLAIVISAFVGSAWFLLSSYSRNSNRHKSAFIAIFVVIVAMAAYGSWLDGDQYLSRHNYNDFDLNPFQNTCTWVAGPGLIVALLVFNRTDIPERDPDTWSVAWLIAPSSALLWTAVLGGGWKLGRLPLARLAR